MPTRNWRQSRVTSHQRPESRPRRLWFSSAELQRLQCCGCFVIVSCIVTRLRSALAAVLAYYNRARGWRIVDLILQLVHMVLGWSPVCQWNLIRGSDEKADCGPPPPSFSGEVATVASEMSPPSRPPSRSVESSGRRGYRTTVATHSVPYGCFKLRFSVSSEIQLAFQPIPVVYIEDARVMAP